MNIKRNLLLTASGSILFFSPVNILAQDSTGVKENFEKVIAAKTQLTNENQSITMKSFGKGIQFTAEDSTFQLILTGRFQTLFVAEKILDDGATDAQTEFMIRRARLKFEGFAFKPTITYKMELGLSNRDWGSPITETGKTSSMILDAVLKWEMVKNLQVWIGQTKLPGNRERVISSQQLQFVDRSIVNSEFNIDRDAGIQIHHKFKLGNISIREAVSLSSGEGRNITVTNKGGYDYTGRIEVLPFGDFTNKGDYFGSDLSREKKPKLSIAGTYDFNDDASRQQGQLGSFLPGKTDLFSIMLDMMFKLNGFSLMTEYMNKHSSNPVVIDITGAPVGAFYVGQGINTQMGYLFKNNFEIAGRYSHIEPDAKIGENLLDQYTLGLSKYIKGHNLKIQTDITLTQEKTVADPELMYRFQVEMAF